MSGTEDRRGVGGAAQLEVTLPDGRTITHELTHDQTNLGRGDQCELQIEDENVSRLHAVVSKRADGYWVTDLGSLNGVVINGKQVESAPLKDGDRFALGTSHVVFRQGAAAAEEPAAPAAATAGAGVGGRNPLVTFIAGAFVLGAVVGGIVMYLGGESEPPPAEPPAVAVPAAEPPASDADTMPAADAAAEAARIAGAGAPADADGAAVEQAAAAKLAAEQAAAETAAADEAAAAQAAAEKAAAAAAAEKVAAEAAAEKAAAEQAAAAQAAEKAAAEQVAAEQAAAAQAAEKAAAEQVAAEQAAAAQAAEKAAAEQAAAEQAAAAQAAEKAAAEQAAAEKVAAEKAAAQKGAAEQVAAEKAAAEEAAAEKAAAEQAAAAEKAAAEEPVAKAAAAAATGDLTGRQIMDEQERRHGVKAEFIESVMILVDETGTKERRLMKNYTKEMADGQDRSMIVFLEPAKVRGTALLTWEQKSRDDDQWLYLPSQKKMQRIAQGSKRSYFMGTDFTYEDNQSEQLDDYKYTVLRSDSFEGSDCWVLESLPITPKKKKESGYSKRIMWVQKDIYLTVKVEYFDRRGRAIKTQTNHKLVNVGGQAWRPDQTLMDNYDRKHKTLRGTQSRKINPTIDDAVFTERYIKSERHLD